MKSYKIITNELKRLSKNIENEYKEGIGILDDGKEYDKTLQL